MKKSIFSLIIGALVALTSCSWSNEMPIHSQTGELIATFTVKIPAETRVRVVAGKTIATDYVLAPLGEKNRGNLMMTFNKKSQKTLLNVPLEQSYKINIKGESSNFYSSTFSFNNQVESYIKNTKINFVKAKVGDFYMKDGTWLPGVTKLTSEQKDNCIGIVYKVNTDGKSGKIVSLDETNKNWYEACTWQSKKILPNGKRWRCPTKDELKRLYCAYADITDTGNRSTSAIIGVKDKFNTQLTAAGGARLTDDYYWSSTEYFDFSAFYVGFNNGYTNGFGGKIFNARVRVVSAF